MFPRIKVPLLASLLVFSLFQRCNADPNEAWKADIANIRPVDRDPERRIYFWDNRIVVVAQSWRDRDSSRFFAFSADASEPVKLSIPGLEEIVGIGANGVWPVALGKRGKVLTCVQKLNGQWNDIAIPPDLAKDKKAWFIPATKGMAILSLGFLFRFVDGAWTTAAMPSLPEMKIGFTPEKWGRRQLLFGDRLFVAWGHGEFGGMLGEVDFAAPQPHWQFVEGSKENGSFGLGGSSFTGMTVAGDGFLWVSGGTPHTMYRALFRYDGVSWKTIVHGYFNKSEGGVIRFPGEETDIADLATSRDGRLYVLAGKLGIFTYEKETLVPQIKFDFYGLENEIEDDKGSSVIYVCYPESLAIDDERDYFVSTQDYGILCFLKHEGAYSLKQVVLPSSRK